MVKKSVFVGLAALCAASAVAVPTLSASAENVYETRTQVIPLPCNAFAFDDGSMLAYCAMPLCFEFSRNERSFSLAGYALDFDVSNTLLTTYLNVGQNWFTEFETYYVDVVDGSFNPMATYLYVTLHTLSYDYLTSYDVGFYYDESNYTYDVTYLFYGGDTLALTVEFAYELWGNGSIYQFDMHEIRIGDSDELLGLPLGSLPFYPYFDYDNAYQQGALDGYSNGFNDGYADGINNAIDGEGLTWKKLITSMINVPINAIREMFDFTILGYDIGSFIFSLLTLAVVLTVINLIL